LPISFLLSLVKALSKAANWQKFFMENNLLDYSNDIYPKIIESAGPGSNPSRIFETFSKNPGIGFLFQDIDGENLSWIHNPGTIGGSWLQTETKLLAMLGISEKAIAVKIKEASIINTKQKVPSQGDLIQAICSKKPLKEVTSLSEVFIYKNFIPIPIILVKSLLSITKFDPDSIAQAFLSALESALGGNHCSTNDSSDDDSSDDDSSTASSSTKKKTIENDNKELKEDDENTDTPPKISMDEYEDEDDTPITKITGRIPRKQKQKPEKLVPIEFLQDIADFDLVFQFCYLCSKEKMRSIIYSVQHSPETLEWQSEIEKKISNHRKSSKHSSSIFINFEKIE